MYQGVGDISVEEVWVVFQDETSLWWLRFLHAGFRHCYLLIPLEDNGYLELNPYSNRLLIRFHHFGEGFNYLNYLAEVKKHQAICCKIQNPPLKSAPLGIFTCVEFAKRTLGIHSRFIITPRQLYKKIKNCRKKVLTN